MPAPPAAVVHLFTDIEGSSRLWDEHPALMRLALAAHDAIVRDAVAAQHGTLVKSTGDGVHAAFDDPLAALQAVLALQRALTDPARTAGMPLAVRCGLHRGADEARDNDFYGPDVNRAARIAGAAHGGQMLLSQTVAEALADRLPEGVTLRNLGAVRLRDLARAEALHQVLAPPLRAEFPPLRSLEATPNNLVQQVSRFIGRGDELGAVRRLLADNRLVTLFGPGGIGKTRLSVQLGAELIDEFRDGVWFVELAPLPPGDEGGRRVPLAVASALGLRESAGQPLADTLTQFVRERRLLLILDNCEHVHAAAAALAKRLLQASAGLHILASSREALHVGGEAVYPVPTLSVPEPSHEHPPEALMQHAAVRLFVDRASAVQPSFRLDADTAVAVADICHRLDGIPLAIELAAARARALPVQTMARRLVDSFRLVATQDETVAPRQRTLRMLIDWSHELLSAPERLLFRRLAVFAGGFTLEAAEAICSGDGLDEDEVLELLLQLADKSLLVCDDGGQRYRMLETIRLYAAERLVDAGDVAVRRRHLQHYLETAEQAHARASGPDQGAWLPELDRERGNLLAAHAFSLQLDDDPDAAMRLAFALLTGALHAERGDLELPPSWVIAHVAQETPALPDPALEFVLDGDTELRQVERALADDGTVYTWGAYAGHDNTTTFRKVPGIPSGLQVTGSWGPAVAISAGWNWNSALMADGRVLSWGFRNTGGGNLGRADAATNYVPGPVVTADTGAVLTNIVSLSAGYMHSLAVDTLKIDRSFVNELDGGQGGVIVEAVIGLAQSLGLDVVAEGVETAAQLGALRQRGCHLIQGYLFARPMPVDDLQRLLRDGADFSSILA